MLLFAVVDGIVTLTTIDPSHIRRALVIGTTPILHTVATTIHVLSRSTSALIETFSATTHNVPPHALTIVHGIVALTTSLARRREGALDIRFAPVFDTVAAAVELLSRRTGRGIRHTFVAALGIAVQALTVAHTVVTQPSHCAL